MSRAVECDRRESIVGVQRGGVDWRQQTRNRREERRGERRSLSVSLSLQRLSFLAHCACHTIARSSLSYSARNGHRPSLPLHHGCRWLFVPRFCLLPRQSPSSGISETGSGGSPYREQKRHEQKQDQWAETCSKSKSSQLQRKDANVFIG